MLWDKVDADRREALRRVSRSFEQTPIALTVADMHLPDRPLVIANETFFQLAGYGADETLGANCRFLQGDLENSSARAEIRASFASGQPLQTVLRNRRKDGREFNNLLFLQPLRDRQYRNRFVLGSQFALSDEHYLADLGVHVDALNSALNVGVDFNTKIWTEQRRILMTSAQVVAEAWMTMR